MSRSARFLCGAGSPGSRAGSVAPDAPDSMPARAAASAGNCSPGTPARDLRAPARPQPSRPAARRAFATRLRRGVAALLLPVASLTAAAGEPLSLELAVQRALEQNYAIKISSYLVPIAQAGVTEAHARFDPRLTFSYIDSTDNQPQGLEPETGDPLPPAVLGSAVYDFALEGELPLGLGYRIGATARNPSGRFDDPMRPDYDYYSSFAGISARLPLLRGFGPAATQTSIRIARADLGISEWDFRATVINTVTDVVYAYNEVLFAYARLRSARRSRELAYNLFIENQRRHEVGSMSEYDVLTARARAATREEDILIAEGYVREVENRLRRLISDNTATTLLHEDFELVPPPEPVEVEVDVERDIELAFQLRPDFQQALLSLQRNELNQRFYRNQLLPAVDLVGSYGYNGIGESFGESRSQITGRSFPNHSIGISVSIPITSSAERARYRSARLARERAEVLLHQLEQDIVVQVANAADEIRIAWERVLATRASRQLSQEALDAELKRLRAGPGSTFEVLQLQEILSNDEFREARALTDYRNALAEYDRQLGRTLRRFNIELADMP